MIAHAAISVDTAGAGARVLAPLVLTGLVRGAVVVDDAFWAAVGRGALDAWEARAVAAAAHIAGRG